MAGQIYEGNNKPYLKIIGGQIVKPVGPHDDKARLRQYELPNGTKGEKWEVPYISWTGKIEKIEFKESEYGETCNIEFNDAYLQLNTAGRYFADFATKIKNADLAKEVTLHPYDFEIEGGKRKTGISVQQEGKKLTSYYYDGKQNLHGFPEVDKEKATKKTYWKIYFAQVAEFLIEELKKMEIPRDALIQDIEKTFGNAEDNTDLPF